jgi:hypothetical protein
VANVTHRIVEEPIYDGSTGQQVDTQVNHQVGVEIEGIFVPFLTKQGGYVDALVSRGQADQQAAQAAQQTQSATDTGTSSGATANPTQASFTASLGSPQPSQANVIGTSQGSARVSPPDEHPAQGQ